MKAEREKWSGQVTAKALRFQTGQYELAEEEEICRIILVSGGSFTLVRGGESLLVNPGCVLLLGPGGGLLQQAGHIAPELIGCRFPAGVLPVLKNLMQRDFMPLFEPGAQTALYGPVQWSGRLRTLLGMMQSAESEPESWPSSCTMWSRSAAVKGRTSAPATRRWSRSALTLQPTTSRSSP